MQFIGIHKVWECQTRFWPTQLADSTLFTFSSWVLFKSLLLRLFIFPWSNRSVLGIGWSVRLLNRIESVKRYRSMHAKWDCTTVVPVNACSLAHISVVRSVCTHQSTILHVLLQPLHGLPADALTLGTVHSAFGYDLQLPTLLLAAWWSKQRNTVHRLSDPKNTADSSLAL